MRFPHLLWVCECVRVLEIRALLREMSASKRPHVIVGDFNAISRGDRHTLIHGPWWVRARVMLQGGVTPCWSLNRLASAGYLDCFRTLNPGEDGYTVPAWRPQVRIDYLFASAELGGTLRSAKTQPSKGAGREVRRTTAELLGITPARRLCGEASDHLAVWSDFEWPTA
ncbi:MAG: hypothetical protein RLZZ53_1495 [Acidobacteriota bacterium]